MNRSDSSSPLRKRPRLSSPTYEAHLIDFNSDDFQALDDIEASLSQVPQAPKQTQGSDAHTPSLAEGHVVGHDLGRHDDPNVMFVSVSDDHVRLTAPTVSQSRNLPSQSVAFKTDAFLRLAVGSAPNSCAAPLAVNFTSAASLAVSSADTIHCIQTPLSHNKLLEQELGCGFATRDASLLTDFTTASAVKPGHAESVLQPTIAFNRASGKAWAPPSAKALEAAKTKLQVWEAEIENELSLLGQDAGIERDQDNPDREPLTTVENLIAPSSFAAVGFSPALATNNSSTNIPVPSKAPGFMTPPHNKKTTSNVSQSHIFNAVLARSSAAASVPLEGSPLRVSSSPMSSTSLYTPPPTCPTVSTPRHSMPSKLMTPTLLPSCSSRGSSQNTKPLGLTPRAHAFTGSKTRPKFVTPFKPGMAPGDQRKEASLCGPQPSTQALVQFKGKDQEVVTLTKKDEASSKITFNLAYSSQRKTLVDCGSVPTSFTDDELMDMGFDIALLNLTAVSHFLYYRFNSAGTNSHPNDHLPEQETLGADSALIALLASGCHLATKAWVDNHWPLILWKLLGMSCLDPTTFTKRWCWPEVMRQLRCRYARELANGVRPALRLITTHDAPSSGPLVLCVSDVLWTDEYVDTNGRLVPAHPELELTDGWYRLRATVDEALARATRNKIIRVGRKIACSGARLESPKKDPMEVLDAYDNVRIVLSGNSTHLARWHAKLGFQSTPFFATLRSLSSDGGSIALMDLLVTQVYPVAYIEYITTESGDHLRVGPRNEKEEAQEEDKWKERRTLEAMKLQEEIEKKLYYLESCADRLERIAGSAFQPANDDHPPESVECLADELEDSEDPTALLGRISKKDAGWLSQSLRRKCEVRRERGGEEVDRELAIMFPPRQVRTFRVLRVQDTRTLRKPSTRTAQLTVWDVMSLNVTEGSPAGSFTVGQRFMVTNLVASQPSAWMGLEAGSEIFLSSKRDSKWRIIG